MSLPVAPVAVEIDLACINPKGTRPGFPVPNISFLYWKSLPSSRQIEMRDFRSEDEGLEKARRFFEVRFWGAVAAAKYAGKRIKSTGSIILTNGIIGLRPQKGWVIAAGICELSKRSPAHSQSNWLR